MEPATPDADLDPKTYRPRLFTRRRAVIAGIVVAVIAGLFARGYVTRIRMPGRSYRGAPPPLSADDARLLAAAQSDLAWLVRLDRPRDAMHPTSLEAVGDDIAREIAAAGFTVTRPGFSAANGRTFENIEGSLRGSVSPDEIVVVGAHFDAADGLPGADDNASGVAAMLALARLFGQRQPRRTLRMVAFGNEEPPFFQTDGMGSLAYARSCHARHERIRVMLSLECLGYYSDAPHTQHYPFPFDLLYPERGNFLGFVGNPPSAYWVRRAVGAFRMRATLPSEGAILDEQTAESGWSDQWSFWQQGYPALMVTDTAVFRNPNYHHPSDTIDTLRLDALVRAVRGLEAVVRDAVDGE